MTNETNALDQKSPSGDNAVTSREDLILTHDQFIEIVQFFDLLLRVNRRLHPEEFERFDAEESS